METETEAALRAGSWIRVNNAIKLHVFLVFIHANNGTAGDDNLMLI